MGYKLLLCAFFDGKTTIPFDFSLHQEKGKQGDCGLTKQQHRKAYHTKRNTGNPDYKRFQECKMSKMEVAMDMLRRGWKMGLHAKYVITDSWFTCEQLMTCVRSIGKGAMHFVGLAKMGKTKYTISGRKKIADATLCYLTYTIMALEKRFTEYQTMGELFSDMEDDLMALTLWKRVLTCIERILRILGETLRITPQHLMATISGNDKELSKILVMAEALEKWDEVVYGHTA